MEGRPCVFCAIVAAGDELVHANGEVAAFLDHRPLFHGHLLVVTRAHLETLADVRGELLVPLFGEVQLAMAALERALGCEGTFVAVNNRVSQSVPHLHVHVVPRRRKDGLRGFFWPRQRYRDEAEFAEVRATIKKAFAHVAAGA